jgi:hypothetical protein
MTATTQRFRQSIALLPYWYYALEMKILTVKLPDGLFLEIADQAKARNISKSEVVRERLTREAQPRAKGQRGSLWSRMRDLVIDSERLPADLSSNRNHLIGYGANRTHR